jgi:uncharacterized repeat protein (TIGR01451 family)/LPXTG-motif cell wall-anchored protein
VAALVGALAVPAAAHAATVVPARTFAPIEPGFIVNGDVLTAGNGLMDCDPAPHPTGDPRGTCEELHTGANANNWVMMRYVDVDSDPATFNSSRATLTIPDGARAVKAWLFWSGDGYPDGQDPAAMDCSGGAPRDPARDAPVHVQVPMSEVLASEPLVAVDGGPYAAAGPADYVADLNGRAHGAVDISGILAGLGSGTHEIMVGNVTGSQGYACAAGWSIHLAYDHGAFDPTDLDTAARKVYTSFGIDSVFGSLNPRSLTFDGFKTTVPGARFLVTVTEGDSDGGGLSYSGDTAVAEWAGGSAPIANALGQTTNVFRSHAEGQVSYVDGIPTASFFNGTVDTFAADVPTLPVGTTSVTFTFRTSGAEGYGPQALTLAVPVGAVLIDKTAPDGTDGQVLVPGDIPTYRLTVSNGGATTLQNVVVSDPLAQECTRDGAPVDQVDGGFVVGDLAIAERVVLTCTGAPVQSGAGTFVNTATVTADDPNGDPVDPASDDSSVFVGEVELEKTVAQPVVPAGDDVTWNIVVRNTGGAPLRDVAVSDEDCTGDLEGPEGTGADAGTLAPEDSWTYRCTEPLLAGKENTATVTATPAVVVDGEEIAGPAVSDSDDASARVAGFTIEKRTNGVDADEAPGPVLAIGDEVVWTYEVGNTGEVEIFDVVVTDDQGVEVPATPSSGDLDADGVLDVGEVWIFTATGEATAGQYRNVGTVAGTFDHDLDPATDPVPLEPQDDPAHYFGAGPAIDLVKDASVDDASVGDLVTYTFVATNTGNVDLSDVLIEETSFTGAGEMSELTCEPAQPATLAPGDELRCTAEYVVPEGDAGAVIDNVATVTGTPSTGAPVTDSDDAQVTVAEAPTPTPTPTPEPTPTPTPEPSPTPTPTPSASATPSPTPTAEPTPTPEPTPTAEPTSTPEPSPTPTPTPSASADPDDLPSTGGDATMLATIAALAVALTAAGVWMRTRRRA